MCTPEWILWLLQSTLCMSTLLNKITVLRLCLFCDYDKCGSTPQANHNFPDFSLTNVKFSDFSRFSRFSRCMATLFPPVLGCRRFGGRNAIWPVKTTATRVPKAYFWLLGTGPAWSQLQKTRPVTQTKCVSNCSLHRDGWLENDNFHFFV